MKWRRPRARGIGRNGCKAMVDLLPDDLLPEQRARGHCLIVAEAGVNHEGDVKTAEVMIRTAKACGADAIKFQTYKAGSLATKTAPTYWGKRASQFETFSKLDGLPWEAYPELVALGRELGIVVFSTPFDLEAVDMLAAAGVEWFKIASADLTYTALLRAVARTGKPVILSTGASTWSEIQTAYDTFAENGSGSLTVLHCTLAYPCPPQAVNLNRMRTMGRAFQGFPRPVRMGFSDHTIGNAAALAAVALGAAMVEKHFTLDKRTNGPSPDHWFSMDPFGLRTLVEDARSLETMMGPYSFNTSPTEEEIPARYYARRSVTSVRDIAKGTRITACDITCKRPGTGISAREENTVIGRVAWKDIPADTTLQWDMISMPEAERLQDEEE